MDQTREELRRIVRLEEELEEVRRRVGVLEYATQRPAPVEVPPRPRYAPPPPQRPQRPVARPVPAPPPRPVAYPAPPTPPQRPAAPAVDARVAAAAPPAPKGPERAARVEDLIGGRLLPWAGAIAVLLGVAFFVAVAIGRGWLGETARIVLAYGGSAILLAAGAWLYEKRGRTQAALAMVGTATASAYLTTAAAVQLYALFPALLGLAIAFGVGTLSTSLALRWDSRTVACLGILGALASPVLLSAGASDAGIAFVATALACSTGVLLLRRWDWLSLAVFAISAPQLIGWAAVETSPVEIVAVVVVFWALYMVAALGHELLVARPTVQTVPAVLSLAAPLVAAAGGYWALEQAGHSIAGDWLIAGLGVAHVALAIVARRSSRLSDDIGRLLLGGGIVMGNTAWGLIVHGPFVAIGWAASAVGIGLLVRRDSKADREFAGMALGAQLCLSTLHVLLYQAPPESTLEQVGMGTGSGALASLAALAIASFACARLTRDSQPLRVVFDVTAMAALAWAAAFALDGAALTAAWAGQAIVLARVSVARRDRLAELGSYAFLGFALVHTLAVEASPRLVDAGGDPALAAVTGLGALAGAFALCARLMPSGSDDRGLLGGLSAATLAYMAPFVLSGPALVAVWAAGAVALAGSARLLRGLDAHVARMAALAWLVLAALHALVFDAPLWSAWLQDDRTSWDAIVAALNAPAAIAAVAAAAFACERLARGDDPARPWLRGLGFAALAYIAPFVLDETALVVVWSAGAAALAWRWRRSGDVVAAGAGAGYAWLAAAHIAAYDAPVNALVDGVDHAGAAGLAVGSLAAALLVAGRLVPTTSAQYGQIRLAVEAAGAITAIYAVSVLIVSSFPPDAAGFDPAVTGIGVRQQGQMLLSAFWAGTGLVALVWGLVRDERSRRVGGLALLSLALAKVFLYDLAALDSIYRVVSFVALGVLLLVGAYAYQRMRPTAAAGTR